MTIWTSLCSWFSAFTSDDTSIHDVGIISVDDHHCDINPASSLPMVGGCGGVDIEGNPYGTDFSQDDSWAAINPTWENGFTDSTSWDGGIGSRWDD